MKRAEMVCAKCIKFDGRYCRSEVYPEIIGPSAVPLYSSELAGTITPDTHWCAQGEWRQKPTDTFDDGIRRWGEWDEDSGPVA